MKSSKKYTFYPEDIVELELRELPRGKFSARVNQLILKGLEVEKQEAIAAAYLKYNSDLSIEPVRDFQNSSAKILSAGAFASEDEVEDFI